MQFFKSVEEANNFASSASGDFCCEIEGFGEVITKEKIFFSTIAGRKYETMAIRSS